jgi:uncharacterized protein YndB with AHSA1/START domain
MPRLRSRSVRNQYYIRAPPKKVFRALTDPKRITRWFADRAELSTRKGGRYLFAWKGGPTHTGKLVEFVRGETVTFAWQWPGLEDAGTTRFKLAVEPRGKGTIVRVTHSKIPGGKKWDDLYAGAIWGWTYFMMNLKSVLETGYDLRSRHDG